MADPIDRNELLNVYKGYRDFDKVYIGSLRAEIKAQPGIYPTQPEPHYDEWCDSCKEYDKEKHCCPRWNKVIKSTIEELKTVQPVATDTNVGDKISRKAAIDAVTDELDMIDHVPKWVFDRLEWRLKQLPSAQPAPCEDAVSRKAAINALTEAYEDIDAEWIINKLPPVTPKQRTGKWIDGIIPNDNGGLPVIVCDQCNTFFPLQFGDGHNFCPNCGAKMDEDRDYEHAVERLEHNMTFEPTYNPEDGSM